MVRSMYSGVAGMKAHQTRMDAIGNNIANVNTYGFKSSRVTFRDIYYQSMRNASAGTGNRGGTNPSQIGYGSTVGSVDVNHGTSTLQNTGNPLDTAISGEGFFQVQDPDGNTFFTKAGLLDIDSYGNLVDVNGNFILGTSGKPIGKPAGSNRIQLTVPSVGASNATVSQKINEINFKISSSKQTADANVTFTFAAADDLPIGQKAEALITSSGINIRLNSKESFLNLAALNTEVTKAIKEANGGAQHPGGDFTITMDPETKFANLTGAEIAGANFGINKGSVTVPAAWKDIFAISNVGDGFTGAGAIPAYKVTQNGPDETATYDFEITIGGKVYKNATPLTKDQMLTGGEIILREAGGGTDTITLGYPSETAMKNVLGVMGAGVSVTANGTGNATASTPSRDLGLGGTPFKLKNGTVGGPQSVEDLTEIAIGSDGVIIGNHPVHGLLELGRIDLATFANPKGLTQSGNTYYAESANSGTPSKAKPGEGGTGALAGGSLEMSNVDLSSEFSDMITTQRGFQANSRLITVSDTMLEELINLKR